MCAWLIVYNMNLQLRDLTGGGLSTSTKRMTDSQQLILKYSDLDLHNSVLPSVAADISMCF